MTRYAATQAITTYLAITLTITLIATPTMGMCGIILGFGLGISKVLDPDQDLCTKSHAHYIEIHDWPTNDCKIEMIVLKKE